eukprot:TRINITY_DN2762_c5_g1_i1.p1 TRINITY_DN2762_c5_g1~~TRINITY_DN2762_c5_g1_i1.p1  ORF type:complete len:598 (+),score=121.25 TRINITY_DN2762_c5_g1_i1:70-1863(+)
MGEVLGAGIAVWAALLGVLLAADAALAVVLARIWGRRKARRPCQLPAEDRPASSGADPPSLFAPSQPEAAPRGLPGCRGSPLSPAGSAASGELQPPAAGGPPAPRPAPSPPGWPPPPAPALLSPPQRSASPTEEVLVPKAAGAALGLAVDNSLTLQDASGPSNGLQRLRGWRVTHVDGQAVQTAAELFAAADRMADPVLRFAPPRPPGSPPRAAPRPPPGLSLGPRPSPRAVDGPGRALALGRLALHGGEGTHTPLVAEGAVPGGATVQVAVVRGGRALVTTATGSVGWVSTCDNDGAPQLVPCPAPSMSRASQCGSEGSAIIVAARSSSLAGGGADYFHPQQQQQPRISPRRRSSDAAQQAVAAPESPRGISPVAIVVGSVPASPVWQPASPREPQGGVLQISMASTPPPPAGPAPRPRFRSPPAGAASPAGHDGGTPEAEWWLTPQRAASARRPRPAPTPPRFAELVPAPAPPAPGASSGTEAQVLSVLSSDSHRLSPPNPLSEGDFDRRLKRHAKEQQRRYAAEMEASGVGGLPRRLSAEAASQGQRPLRAPSSEPSLTLAGAGQVFHVTPSAAQGRCRGLPSPGGSTAGGAWR